MRPVVFIFKLPSNGSPAPSFESDDERTSFVVRLPRHPLAQDPDIGEVTMEVAALLKVVQGEMSRQALQTAMGLKNADHFRKAYVLPAIAADCLEMTLPKQPNSRLQRYRLTRNGQQWLHTHGEM